MLRETETQPIIRTSYANVLTFFAFWAYRDKNRPRSFLLIYIFPRFSPRKEKVLARSRNFPPRFLQGRASRGFFPLAFYELISRITREQACDECGNKLNIKVGDNGEGFFSLWERGTIAFFSPLPHKFFFTAIAVKRVFREVERNRAHFSRIPRAWIRDRIKPVRIEILFSPLSGIVNEVVG